MGGCFLVIITGNKRLYAQAHTYMIEIKGIQHNPELNTIDLYVLAQKNGKSFSNFTHDNLKICESLNATNDSCENQLEWPILDVLKKAEFFGNEEGIRLSTRSPKGVHTTPRTYKIKWLYEDEIVAENAKLKMWSEFDHAELKSKFSFLDALALGLLIVVVALLVLSEVVPYTRYKIFHNKYVMPYDKAKILLRKHNNDPDPQMSDEISISDDRRVSGITGRELRGDKQVVMYCGREECGASLVRWKKKNYQCPNYPQKCNGEYHIGFRRFFQQADVFRQLNWLWFGTLGGLFAWVLNSTLGELVGEDQLLKGLIYGLSLGFGLTALLSWVEEIGEPGGFHWERVLLRIVLGTLISGLIFVIGTVYVPLNSQLSWLFHILIWVLFSVSLGAILSINSFIKLKRGLFSGLIAGLISSFVYVAVKSLFEEVKLAQISSFIIMGGLIGWGIIQVVKQLQVVELQVISPPERRGLIFPLDKFLSPGKKVVIGKEMRACDVRIKWKDATVLSQHAEMIMRDNKVAIYPLTDMGVLVNNIPLEKHKAYELQGGEVIQLGRQSRTQFKYLQKSSN